MCVAMVLSTGCRTSDTATEPAPVATRTIPVAQVRNPTPAWGEAANLRVSTVGLEREQLLALRPADRMPVFVRVDPSGVLVRRCDQHGPVYWRFEPETPVSQRWQWSGVEFEANVRVGRRLEGNSETEVGLTPAGTYWLDRSKIGSLRRVGCEDATHFVAGFRVGRLDWLGEPPVVCAVDPTSVAAPSGCDWPWLLELVALDPHAAPGPACPDATVWTGRYCRSRDRPSQESEPFCTANTQHAHECHRRWPLESDWDDELAGLPRALDADELGRVLEPLTPSLRACGPELAELGLVIHGPTGRVIELELPEWTTSEHASCIVAILTETQFATFAQAQQSVRFDLGLQPS